MALIVCLGFNADWSQICSLNSAGVLAAEAMNTCRGGGGSEGPVGRFGGFQGVGGFFRKWDCEECGCWQTVCAGLAEAQ